MNCVHTGLLYLAFFKPLQLIPADGGALLAGDYIYRKRGPGLEWFRLKLTSVPMECLPG